MFFCFTFVDIDTLFYTLTRGTLSIFRQFSTIILLRPFLLTKTNITSTCITSVQIFTRRMRWTLVSLTLIDVYTAVINFIKAFIGTQKSLVDHMFHIRSKIHKDRSHSFRADTLVATKSVYTVHNSIAIMQFSQALFNIKTFVIFRSKVNYYYYPTVSEKVVHLTWARFRSYIYNCSFQHCSNILDELNKYAIHHYIHLHRHSSNCCLSCALSQFSNS